MWRKGNPVYCWQEGKLVQLLWKTVWRFLKKIKLAYDPAILLLGIYPKKMKSLSQRNICTPKFIAVLFTVAKVQKQLKCLSLNKWIKNVAHRFNEYYSALKKKKILSFVKTQMNLESIMLSEISHIEKDKYCMASPLSRI